MLTTEISKGVESDAGTNLNQKERLVSAIGGGALLLFGLHRLSVPAVLLTIAGGALLSRGLSGYCPIKGVGGFGLGADEPACLANIRDTTSASERTRKSNRRSVSRARRDH
ncbi:MAG TPA: YgaP-like transmembrane domain [Planctomycetaceae bacterium]|nr:YgaP-like transmembrane domain [Planctomycetaceae bacterium]